MAKKQIIDREVQLTAQEIKFAKVLAGNDQKLRDKALKRLQKWLQYRSQSSMKFTEADFMRQWKGLFYCLWMADKLLPQEACAELIAKLIHSLKDVNLQLLFFKAHIQTMINEFYGIDQLRLNKFLMLVRRVLRQTLTCIRNTRWKIEHIKEFGDILTETILNYEANQRQPLGLVLHFIEIYLEEVSKTANSKLSNEETLELIRPFAKQLPIVKDNRVLKHIVKYIFRYLMNQSDLGIEYQEKFKAWQQRGFPGGSIDALQKVEASDDEEELDGENGGWDVENNDEKPKDPRAGRVDVELPQISFDPKKVVEMLASYKFHKQSNTKTRKTVTGIIAEYQKFSGGEFPLGLKRIKVPTEEDLEEINVQNAAKRLIALEDELVDQKLTKAQKRKLKKQGEVDIEESESGITEAPPLKKMKKQNNVKKESPEKPTPAPEKWIKVKKLNFEESLEKPTPTPEKYIKVKKLNFEKKPKPNKLSKIEKKSTPGTKFEKIVKLKKQLQTETRNKAKTLAEKLNKANGKLKNAGIVFGADDQGTLWQITTESTPEKKETSPKKKETPPKKKETTPKKKETKKPTKKEKAIAKFPESKWDSPLQEGETEIFVPSKKFKSKLEKEATKKGTTVNKLLTKVNTKILANKKEAITPVLVENPFSPKSKIKRGRGNIVTAPKVKQMVSKPDSKSKKVRIMLSLNKAQNTSDYVKQILSSPNIPYDARKKPSKPLLKKKGLDSPINPFYKLNDSL